MVLFKKGHYCYLRHSKFRYYRTKNKPPVQVVKINTHKYKGLFFRATAGYYFSNRGFAPSSNVCRAMNHQDLFFLLIHKKYDCLLGRDILARTAPLNLQHRPDVSINLCSPTLITNTMRVQNTNLAQ